MATLGMFHIARRLSLHLPRILMYHGFCGPGKDVPGRMPVHVFRRQLEYIKRYYRPLKLTDLVKFRSHYGVYPLRAAVITVDDGYADFYRCAYPVLREFEVPATVFVVSGLINKNEWIWVDKVLYLCEHADDLSILSKESRKSLFNVLMRLPVAEREELVWQLAEQAEVTIPEQAPPKYSLMSWEQLAEIAGSGLIEIGSHTQTHPILSSLNSEESWKEIYTSRNEIEERLGVSVNSFAYPNGAPGDYREDHIEMLRRAGYACAVVTDRGYVEHGSNILRLPRISGFALDDRDQSLQFLKGLDGVEYWQKRVLRHLPVGAS
jgi:peptidoglycan/xylan/chitin deacetylase (PgdA/CDA1 family)